MRVEAFTQGWHQLLFTHLAFCITHRSWQNPAQSYSSLPIPFRCPIDRFQNDGSSIPKGSSKVRDLVCQRLARSTSTWVTAELALWWDAAHNLSKSSLARQYST